MLTAALEVGFAKLLALARRMREQRQRQGGPTVYSLHAPEVECIGKGKAHRPYEFGVKVSVAITVGNAKGGQFVAHVTALAGNPYEGHTQATAITYMEALGSRSIAKESGWSVSNVQHLAGLSFAASSHGDVQALDRSAFRTSFAARQSSH